MTYWIKCGVSLLLLQSTGYNNPHAPPPPPQNLREWYHFVRETHLIEIPHVTSNKVGTDCVFRQFFKMAASRK